MNPRVFKQSGLKHLDRVVDLVRELPAACPLEPEGCGETGTDLW